MTFQTKKREALKKYLDDIISQASRVHKESVGLGGLGVTCSPQDPRFAGSDPAEVDGYFSGHKNCEDKSSRRDFKLGVSSLRFQAC